MGLPYPERKLTKFLIMFDNSNLLYFPGQFLSGRVIVELQDEMAITGDIVGQTPASRDTDQHIQRESWPRRKNVGSVLVWGREGGHP